MNDWGPGPFILTINGGSSSLKFALYGTAPPLLRLAGGMIDRIGLTGSVMTVTGRGKSEPERRSVDAPDHAACAGLLLDWLEKHVGLTKVRAIGHRVVHGGMRYNRPTPVTPDVLAELRRISPYDPEHMPSELALIEAFSRCDPKVRQIACFDTAFHHGMPRVARLLAIPRRYDKTGVRRYGFHGLSCAFLMKELARIGTKEEAGGRVILAHLGNGASMTAVVAGKSVETTMGFTPTAGLPMSRRSGDLDPGLVSYLARTEGMSVEQFHKMVNTESGLLGVSELSPDMRDLLAQEHTDQRAAEAVALFCYQAKKTVGALAAAMGGLDTLVFSAGIGERSPVIRARVCDGLGFLGLELDPGRNGSNEPVISKEGSRVTVRVIPTDEESEIAQSTLQLLASGRQDR
jgi:acetate kinase